MYFAKNTAIYRFKLFCETNSISYKWMKNGFVIF